MSKETVSIYFQIKEGEKADLEVVAQAVLHWTASVRAAYGQLEPSSRIRIELVDATEGSLRLNVLFEWVEDQINRVGKGASKHPKLAYLAAAFAVFLIQAVAGHYIEELLSGDQVLELSREDRELIKDLTDQLRSNHDIELHGRRFFNSLEKDRSILGVGISESRDKKPFIFAKRDTFAERGGLFSVEQDGNERTIYTVLDVVLISPSLVDAQRSWKFRQEGLPEFTAIMADQRFLNTLNSEGIRENLRTGIKMRIRLAIREQLKGSDWVVKPSGRKVIEVIHPSY